MTDSSITLAEGGVFEKGDIVEMCGASFRVTDLPISTVITIRRARWYEMLWSKIRMKLKRTKWAVNIWLYDLVDSLYWSRVGR
jgi:hypothetical protein